MPRSQTVQVIGGPELERQLRALGDDALQACRGMVARAVKPLKEDVARSLPLGTKSHWLTSKGRKKVAPGWLRKHAGFVVTAKATPGMSWAGVNWHPNMFYGLFLEKGWLTGKRHPGSRPRTAKAWRAAVAEGSTTSKMRVWQAEQRRLVTAGRTRITGSHYIARAWDRTWGQCYDRLIESINYFLKEHGAT